MICPRCNKGISDDSIFCSACGQKIGGVYVQDMPVKKKKPINKKLIIGIVAAVVAVAGIGTGVYINSTPEAKYNKAERAFENGNYERAIKYYSAAGGYKNARDKLAEAELANHHAIGLGLLDDGSYEDAKRELELANGYEDSVRLIKQCDYKIAEGYVDAGDYLAAAEAFKDAADYEDANDRILGLGQELVLDSKYADAVSVYECAEDWSLNPYAQYAAGMVNLDSKNYFEAVINFKGAGDLLDAKDKYNEAQYAYASEKLQLKEYGKAKSAFEKIPAYNDSASLINACDLLSAAEEMDAGNLNTAKKILERMPNDYTYNNISVFGLLDKLNANSQWLSICGKWVSTGGQIRSIQNGSYGYQHEWYYEFKRWDEFIDVRCKLNNDGSVTIVTEGEIPIYTNFSSISAGLEMDTQSVSINETVSGMGTIRINDLTTITFSPSQISVLYNKVDHSHDVYFSYTYKTDIIYGEKTKVY